MSTLKVSTIAPLGTDATKTITIGSHSNGDTAAGVFTNGPSFLSFLTSSQSTANDTATTIIFNSIIFETTNSGYDTSTGRFTPTVAGKYFLYANVTGKQNSGGSKNVEGISSIQTTYFGAYRIIGA